MKTSTTLINLIGISNPKAIIYLILFSLLCMSGCTDEDEPEDMSISSIMILPDDENIISLSQEVLLTVTAKNAAGDVVASGSVNWESSDQNILSINSSAMIKGESAGTATISATAEGVTGRAEFTVVDLTGKWIGGESPDTVSYTLIQTGTDVAGTFNSRLGFPPITDVTSGTLTGSLNYDRYDHILELTTETGCTMRVSGPHFVRIEGGEIILSPGSGSIDSPNCNLNGTIDFARLRKE